MKRAAAILSVFLSVLIAADALLTGAYAQTPPAGIVLAQGEPNIFRFLFGNQRRRVAPPRIILRRAPPPQRRQASRPRRQQREAARPRRQREASRPRRERSAAPVPREVAAVEKAENAKRVLVVGDFMAAAMSKGLAEAYAENPNVVVIDATSGSSGLVRADHYDWPAQLPGLVEAQKPDAILVMVGANDRQGIDTESGPKPLGSDGWRTAYAARVGAFADALKASRRPVLWAGLAPVESNAMSRDYSAMNGIMREQLEAKGIPFIETWNGFADEEGKFVAAGPDVAGQPVQLRDSDGLNFTRAGQRKLAFFVEQELATLLGGAAVPQLAAIDPAAVAPAVTGPGENDPLIGPMVPIDALVTGGDALSAAAPAAAEAGSGAVVTTISKRLAGAEESVAPSGRIDQYAWPRTPPAAANPSLVALPAAPTAPLTGPPPALSAAPPAPSPSAQ